MNNFTKIAAAACLMLMGTSASAATVVNGSFEDIGTGSFNGSGWNHFSSIPGWTGNPNVEIQSDPTLSGINAQHGSNYAELDTNQDGGISQNIYFAAGDYELSFFYSPRVNASPTSTNDMNFSLGRGSPLTSGSILGAPDINYPWGKWTEVKSRFSVAAEGFYLHDRLLRPAQVGVSSMPAS